VESLEHLNRPSIIVAHDLSPSDTAGVDLANTLAIAIDVSGPTSHTAILARAFEIPAVVGLKYVSAHALASDMMIVDGTRGHVFIRPDPSTLEEYEREKKRREEKRLALMHRECESKSSTLDGHKTPTMANIELPVEVTRSLKTGAQGIGLYRTEYLYLNRTTLPTEEEQFRAYSEVAAAMNPRLVILRTLDLGGDKFASHLRVADEINPQLGWRAIRFCLERLDIFKAQLRAMLRATVHGNVSIMFPLISGLDELRRVKQVVQEVCDDLERRVVPFRRDVKLGAMIEVPSAVAIADALARECDFFSIGTNDLVQYALAVDRVNEKIAHMYQPAHPAILRYIRDTVRAARRAHIPCSICGEMAGDPLYTELLVGLGVDSLSMSAVAIPIVRSQIASIRYSSAKRFAKNLLNLSSVEEIKTLLRERLKRSRGIAMIADEITSIEPDGKE
jgi:phosphoenolpyruvate-protein phosphotransferase (PTS system enzyme I)